MRALEDEHWWFRGRRAVIKAMLDRVGHPGFGSRSDPGAATAPRILDAGCGTGGNLAALTRMGRASGVDPSERAVAFCREDRGLDDVHRAALDSLPFADGEFDLVLLADVLEHVGNDHEALRELRRVAAPGAVLMVTTPAYRWLWSHQDDSHHHHRRYTRGDLAERVRAAGWEVVDATYFNAILFGPIAFVRKLLRPLIGARREDTGLTPGALNDALALPMRAEASLIRRGVMLPFGVSIGLTARAGADVGEAGRVAP